MRSKYSLHFNHDDVSDSYDKLVLNERNPIREGYQDILSWIGKNVPEKSVILDLGSGTGNIISFLPAIKKLYCVDVSEKMLTIAQSKFNNYLYIEYVNRDILEFFNDFHEDVDCIISSYCIHHLIQFEKHELFKLIAKHLKEKGIAIFGDLMFENIQSEKILREKYPELRNEFDEEFFWNIEQEIQILEDLGFKNTKKQFSDLSWGILSEK